MRRNIPAIVDEPFSLASSNYKERLQLRINAIESSGLTFGVQNTWEKVNRALLDDFHYYLAVQRKSDILSGKAKELAGSSADPEQKARAIFAYIRNAIHVAGYTDIYTEPEVDKIMQTHSASPSEINFLLVALLRNAGLEAYPVLITTSDERRALPDVPDVNQFSKTICEVTYNKSRHYLDASGRNNSFDILPAEDCNGHARVVTPSGGRDATLEASDVKEKSFLTVKTESADPSNYILNVSYQFGQQAAIKYRDEWQDDTSAIRQFVKATIARLGVDASLVNYRLSGLGNPDTGLALSYSIKLDWATAATAYVNPHFLSAFRDNPFKAKARILPVSMPYTLDDYYVMMLQLPTGYKADEVPKSNIVTLPGGDYNKYMVAVDNATNTIQLSSRIHLQQTWTPTDGYSDLKQFFDKIIESQQSTYVLKKL